MFTFFFLKHDRQYLYLFFIVSNDLQKNCINMMDASWTFIIANRLNLGNRSSQVMSSVSEKIILSMFLEIILF